MNKKDRFVGITVDARKIRRIEKALGRFPEIVKEELKKAMQDVVLAIEGKAKELCPVMTGKLRASIKGEVESWFRGFIGTNTEYAPWVEYGTDPHPITPTSGKALAFDVVDSVQIFGKRGQRLKHAKESSKTIIVKSVEHPGTPAQPFLEPAFEYGKKIAAEYMDAALERAIRRIDRMMA